MQHLSDMSEKKNSYMANMLRGASVAVVFIAFATIGAELYIPFKNWLASVFSHHWIGKGVLAALIFFIISMMPNKRQVSIAEIAGFTRILFFVSILSAFAIVGFVGYEAFIK